MSSAYIRCTGEPVCHIFVTCIACMFVGSCQVVLVDLLVYPHDACIEIPPSVLCTVWLVSVVDTRALKMPC